MINNILIVICGATASGKSGLALKLAQGLNRAVISADSRQVYREFNIGTAKPSLAEQKLVPHYLIDICEPTETLTLAEYQQQAQTIISYQLSVNSYQSPSPQVPKSSSPQVPNSPIPQVSKSPIPQFPKSPIPQVPNSPIPQFPNSPSPQFPNSPILQFPKSPSLLVGGTGLYIKSITRGLKIPRVAPHPELRSQLTALGQNQLYSFLCQIDAIAATKIHPNDQIRTLRALEVYYVTGQTISSQQGENPPSYPIVQIGLDCDVDVLDKRIAKRTYQMLELGLVEEVSQLCSKYGSELPLLDTLGYGEIKQYLAGDITLEKAIADIILHTRQFAKRQRTWFRSIPEITWFDVNDPNLLDNVIEHLSLNIKHLSLNIEH